EYEPVMPAGSTPREITSYSVLLGLVMTVIFSAAAAYLGLKVGSMFVASQYLHQLVHQLGFVPIALSIQVIIGFEQNKQTSRC
ncbi:hypothetical protein, partial [Porphyromonas gingivalis]|uniref:hypothetical protein n=1 Tax=Porphyromonas gingivalis TaxID=837 RepID=UPI0015CF5E11